MPSLSVSAGVAQRMFSVITLPVHKCRRCQLLASACLVSRTMLYQVCCLVVTHTDLTVNLSMIHTDLMVSLSMIHTVNRVGVNKDAASVISDDNKMRHENDGIWLMLLVEQ